MMLTNLVLCRVSKDVPCRGLAFATSAASNSTTQAVKTTVLQVKYSKMQLAYHSGNFKRRQCHNKRVSWGDKKIFLK